MRYDTCHRILTLKTHDKLHDLTQDDSCALDTAPSKRTADFLQDGSGAVDSAPSKRTADFLQDGGGAVDSAPSRRSTDFVQDAGGAVVSAPSTTSNEQKQMLLVGERPVAKLWLIGVVVLCAHIEVPENRCPEVSKNLVYTAEPACVEAMDSEPHGCACVS